MQEIYKIEDAVHYQHTGQPFLSDPNFCPEFPRLVENFKTHLTHLVNTKQSATYIHFGDGDYYFLKKMPVGSAAPGRRALSIPYDKFDVTPFREGFPKNTAVCVEFFESAMPPRLRELYPSLPNVIPTEILYGLNASRWFCKQFAGKISILGAKEKLDLIRELLKRKEYQEYLGIESFNEYIEIPQKFACDNIEATFQMVKQQLEKCSDATQVFLFGVGHVKSGLIHRLPDVKGGVYLDIGGGIDALAGIIDPYRPFSYGWTNFRLRSYDYSKVDYLNYDIHQDKNLKWID